MFYILLKVIPVSLKNKFHVNPVETFCKIDEKLNFENQIISGGGQDTSACQILGHSFHEFSLECSETPPDGQNAMSPSNFVGGDNKFMTMEGLASDKLHWLCQQRS